MFKLGRKGKIILISALAAFTTVTAALSTIAWFVGMPTIDSSIDSDIKNLAGYFDSNTGEGNGEGTQLNPFIITKPVHLHNLMRLQNESRAYKAISSSLYFEVGKYNGSGKYYVYNVSDTGVIGDFGEYSLNMRMYQNAFNPIGSSSRPFLPHFDGHNVEINKITVNSSSSSYTGFFGYTTSAVVSNVTLNNYVINVTGTSTTVGLLAGYAANSNNFTGCNVKNMTINNSGGQQITSKFGFFGKVGNVSDAEYNAAGSTTNVSLNASDITSSSHNTFADWQYDHKVARTDFSQSTGTVDPNNNFSTAVDASGYLQEGHKLSTAGHVVSDTSKLYYNNGSSVTEIAQTSVNNGSTQPTSSSSVGQYFYKGTNNYQYSTVEERGSDAGVYNVFVISTKSESGTTAYLKYDGTTNPASLKAVTTAPGTYAETPDYYFALLKTSGAESEAHFGYQNLLANQAYSVYLYSPANGKHLIKEGSSFNFYNNVGNKTLTAFNIPASQGILKTLPGLYVSFSGSTPTISSSMGTYNTYFSLTSSGTSTPIWNKPRETNEGPSIAALGDTYSLVTDASTLAVNDVVVIVAKDSDVAMSTTQNTNNRGQVSITKNTTNNTISWVTNLQELTLVSGNINNTYGFYTGSGYLYAASSSSNHLKTGTSLTANSSFSVSISGTTASLTAQGTNTRNKLKYNSSSSIFSCYSSGQNEVSLYKKVSSKTLSSIALSGTYKTEYIYNEDLDTTGLTVTAKYSDNSTKDVTSSATFSGYSKTTIGVQTITVSYTENGTTKTTTYSVEVFNGISDFSITTLPTQKFNVGDDFNSSGLVVQAKLNGVTTDLLSSVYSVNSSTVNKNQAGTYTITVTYTGTYRYSGSNPPSATYSVTYYALPNPTIGPASVSIVQGQEASLTLSGSNISDASWSIVDNPTCLSIKPSTASTSGVVVQALLYDPDHPTATVQVVCTNAAGGQTTATKQVTITPIVVSSISTSLEEVTMTLDDSPINVYNTITFNPSNAYDKTVTYSVEAVPDGCISISSDGIMTPIAAGIAEVTITSNSNSSATDKFMVEVLSAAKDPTITPDSGNVYIRKYDSNNNPVFNATCVDTTSVTASIAGPGTPTVTGNYQPLTGEYQATINASENGVYEVTFTPYYNEIAGTPYVATYKLYEFHSLTIDSSHVQKTFNINSTFNSTNLSVTANYYAGSELIKSSVLSASDYTLTVSSDVSSDNHTFINTGFNKPVTISYTDTETPVQTKTGSYNIDVYRQVSNFTITSKIGGSDGYTSGDVSNGNITILVGESKTFSVNFSDSPTNPQYAYSTSDSSKVTCSGSGSSFVLAGVAATSSPVTITVNAKSSYESGSGVTKTFSVTVLSSIASSQTPSIPSIPFENKVTHYDLLVDLDHDGNYEIFNPSDANPQFHKEADGYWYVTVGRTSGWTDYHVVTSADQILDGDSVIMLNSPVQLNHSGAPEGYQGDNVYLDTIADRETDTVYGFSEDHPSFTISGGVIPYETVYNSDCWEFGVIRNGDGTLSFTYEVLNDDNLYAIQYSSSSDNTDIAKATQEETVIGGVPSAQARYSIESVTSEGCARILCPNVDSTSEPNPRYLAFSQSKNTDGALGRYQIPAAKDNSWISIPKLLVSHPAQMHDFIGDNVQHTAGGTYNPITKAGVRYDIIGGSNASLQSTQLTNSSINITSTASKTYSAALSSGAFDPTSRLANTVLAYIPKTGAYDLGTLRVDYVGSQTPSAVRSTGGAPLSISNYVNAADSSLFGNSKYMSFNQGNIHDIAYCGIDSSGNYTTNDSNVAFYVIALTAPQGKTIQISSVNYEFTPIAGNNVHLDTIPFAFAFDSALITSIGFSYNSTYSRYSFTTSGSGFSINFINYRQLKQYGDSNPHCYIMCDLNLIKYSLYRYTKS